MKIQTKGYYPFTITAETKVSKSGNSYLAIGLCKTEKNQAGEYDSKWLNFIDKVDLLKLSSVCEKAYHDICEAEQRDFENGGAKPSQTQSQEAIPAQDLGDDIPF